MKCILIDDNLEKKKHIVLHNYVFNKLQALKEEAIKCPRLIKISEA